MFEKARAGMKFRAEVTRRNLDDLRENTQKLRGTWGDARDARRELAELRAQGPSEADKVGVAMTYACFLLGGLLGAHRIWMGRSIRSTLVYVLTGNYLMLGWAWDAITIPAQVRRINYKIDLAIAKRHADIAALEAARDRR